MTTSACALFSDLIDTILIYSVSHENWVEDGEWQKDRCPLLESIPCVETGVDIITIEI